MSNPPTATGPTPPHFASRFHVVLVEPGNSINIGAAARAMHNLGFGNLHLVAPPHYRAEQAESAACWAKPLLDSMRVHSSLEEALAPMDHVVGFSARGGVDRPRLIDLPQWAEQVAPSPFQQVALLFGPEDHGLENRHLTQCRWLVRIPCHAQNPSFNLAQAVLVALYEITRTQPPTPLQAENPPATQNDFNQLDRLVDEAASRCQFYNSGTPKPIPDMLRHILRRTDPDKRDMAILLGLFGKINRALLGRVPVKPLEGDGAETPPLKD